MAFILGIILFAMFYAAVFLFYAYVIGAFIAIAIIIWLIKLIIKEAVSFEIKK